MTPTKAIRLARKNVSALYRMGDGWCFNEYVAGTGTYQHGPRQYTQAIRWRRETLIRQALIAAGMDYEDAAWAAYHDSDCYEGMAWTRRVQRELAS